jgi:hypothetical protein
MPDPTDRRAAERFPVNADTSCTFVAKVVEEFGQAKLKNISTDGIGLLLTRPVQPGTLLTVRLSNPRRSFTKTTVVRVVHGTPHEGGFLVGCTFDTPLSYTELTTLVM